MSKLSDFLKLQYHYATDINKLKLPGVIHIRPGYGGTYVQIALSVLPGLELSLKELEQHSHKEVSDLIERGNKLDCILKKFLGNLNHSVLKLDAICYLVQEHKLPEEDSVENSTRLGLAHHPFAVLTGDFTLEKALETVRSEVASIQARHDDFILEEAMVRLEVLELSLVLDQPVSHSV